jgi:hypothetical protein
MTAGRGVVPHFYLFDSTDLSSQPLDLGLAGLIPQIAISGLRGNIVGNLASTSNIPPLTYTNGPALYDTSEGWVGLSSLIQANYPEYPFALLSASSVNDDGQIVGQMLVRGDTAPHGYLAMPWMPGRAQRSVDGDARGDYAVYRRGNWYLDATLVQGAYQWGLPGDLPIADKIVWRPASGTWYIKDAPSFQFGLKGDYPFLSDYDGDQLEDFAVFRPLQSISGLSENQPAVTRAINGVCAMIFRPPRTMTATARLIWRSSGRPRASGSSRSRARTSAKRRRTSSECNGDCPAIIRCRGTTTATAGRT